MDQPLINFDVLPDEIILNILIKTNDLDTLGRWCQTSKRVARICNDKQLWKTKVLNEYGKGIVLKSGETWKDKYRTFSSSKIAPISVISSGYDHYGIVDEKGLLYMGGNNENGQLGIGKSSNDRKIFNPVQRLKFSPKVVQVSCGDGITGAMTDNGDVYVWGWNIMGLLIDIPSQQGKYERPPLVSPTKLTLPIKAIKISFGAGYAVLLKNRSVYYSIVNVLTIKGGGSLDSVASKGIVEINAIDISAGSHAIAVIDMNYDLYIWGKILGSQQMFEASGMLYDEETKETIVNPIKIELPMPVRQVSASHNFISVLSAQNFAFILRTNLLLFLIQEGKEGLKRDHIPYLLPIIRPPKSVSYISSSEKISVAVTEDDKLYILYAHTRGDDGLARIYDPIQIDIGLPVKAISIGNKYNLAITEDGVVNLWENFKVLNIGGNNTTEEDTDLTEKLKLNLVRIELGSFEVDPFDLIRFNSYPFALNN